MIVYYLISRPLFILIFLINLSFKFFLSRYHSSISKNFSSNKIANYFSNEIKKFRYVRSLIPRRTYVRVLDKDMYSCFDVSFILNSCLVYFDCSVLTCATCNSYTRFLWIKFQYFDMSVAIHLLGEKVYMQKKKEKGKGYLLVWIEILWNGCPTLSIS